MWASNLDEFFMVRVAGLHDQVDAGVTEPGADGRTPDEVIEGVREQVLGQIERAHHQLRDVLAAPARRPRDPHQAPRRAVGRESRPRRGPLPPPGAAGAHAARRRRRSSVPRTSPACRSASRRSCVIRRAGSASSPASRCRAR
ncbi:MAG: hypothetical protein PGN13_06730 [Patulibacter minatonensis]